ncbi:hypothetical protein [Fimbriiglobus ruber]|uniref:Uncharacterized protein n=1 Tax=Fimbriiglobus ruber TaxID=1908690 RepID=A0A225D4Q3_9BACT|nr:hypothetical protein [Fimbriiglobus ruber]OWK36581.1 hypothetical protein FRUB_09144 [Fimbriiglobus ruber]
MPPKPFDPTLKALVETSPESWLPLVGGPPGPADVIDADIATVSGAADKVIRVRAKPTYLLHLEFAVGHDTAALPRKLLVRNGLLDDRHDLLVRSVVVLLRSEADSPKLDGRYIRQFHGQPAYLSFMYQVIRVWQLPPEKLLSAGPALFPLAPISAVTEQDVPGIIKRMGASLTEREASFVWPATFLLLGLRYTPSAAARLLRGMVSMKESSTYQAILEEGREEGREEGAVIEARRLLRLFGERLFGPPDARTARVIDHLNDRAQLEELHGRVPTAAGWNELIPKTAAPRRRGNKKQP